MIYLIDEKKLRQEIDFGWTSDLLAKYKETLLSVHSLEELEFHANEILKDNNIVLYHESFLDNTHLNDKSAEKRAYLENFAKNNSSFLLIIFSGSKNSRRIDGNIAHLPVSVVYDNLKIFIDRYLAGDRNLSYLAYGDNPLIENDLILKYEYALARIEKDPAVIEFQSCFFIPTYDKFIQNPINEATIADFYDCESDIDISNFISSNLDHVKYDNIFIPLAYGKSLSDYNGLRLATSIRCTVCVNQLSRIFIYGFVGIDYLVNNQYFNILKTKNVFLTSFSKKAFSDHANKPLVFYNEDELSREIAKLKLEAPKNYADHHSIANEWAIYRWAKCLDLELTEELEHLFQNISSNLYFKYLKTVYPIQPSDIIEYNRLSINKIGDSKILLIDDEAEKGWNELIAFLLDDINDIQSDFLGTGFKICNSDEIISNSLNKIKQDDIDVVILDYKLNYEDFEQSIPNEITSVKLLKEIKKFNYGIQVIVFSATNKIWDLQILQKAGADGFILKESIENSLSKDFTKNSINSFIDLVNKILKRVFLKKLFSSLSEIQKNLITLDFEDGTEYHNFIRGIYKQVEIIIEAAKLIDLDNKSTLDIAFLNCYNLLEQFKNKYYLKDKKYNYFLGIDELKLKRYKPHENGVIDEGLFTPNNLNDKPSFFHVLTALIVDYFKICNINDGIIEKLIIIKKNRNDFIHNDKEHLDTNDLLLIIDLIKIVTKHMRE